MTNESFFDTVEYAPLWMRVAAWLADIVILFIVLLAMCFLAYIAHPDEGALMPIAIIIWLLIAFVYPIAMIPIFGATIGKMLFRMRVVMQNGGRPGFGTAINRHVTWCILCMGILSAITALWSSEKQCVHDIVAHTFVIRLPKKKLTADG